MKKMTKILALAVLVSVIFASCSMEKRHYSKGFYIQWKHNLSGSGEAETDIANEKAVDFKREVVQNEIMSIEANSVIANVDDMVLANKIVENNVSFDDVRLVENSVNTSNLESNEIKEFKSHSATRKTNKVQKLLVKQALKSASNSTGGGGPSKGLLIVLCFLIPWLAVGLATDWELQPIIYNLLWSLTCIGGIIHAIIVVNREA